MKIIELLNLVYEKKAPKRILYKYCEYEFNPISNDYINKDGMFQIHCEDGVNASIFMFQVWSESIEVIGNVFDKKEEL